MDKNKFIEIKNRTAHIHALILELEEAIKEVEFAETVNTSKRRRKADGYEVHIAASSANEIEDETDEVAIYPKWIKVAGIAVIMMLTVFLMNNA